MAASRGTQHAFESVCWSPSASRSFLAGVGSAEACSHLRGSVPRVSAARVRKPGVPAQSCHQPLCDPGQRALRLGFSRLGWERPMEGLRLGGPTELMCTWPGCQPCSGPLSSLWAPLAPAQAHNETSHSCAVRGHCPMGGGDWGTHAGPVSSVEQPGQPVLYPRTEDGLRPPPGGRTAQT